MRLPALIPLLALTAACTPITGDFPGLGVRPIEGRGDEIAAPPPNTATVDATVATRITTLAAEAAAARASFNVTLPQAQNRAAAAGPEGSDSWVAAQLSLTALDGARATTVAALAEVDRLLVAEYGANRPVAPETAGVAATLQDSADAQAQAIAAIRQRLAR